MRNIPVRLVKTHPDILDPGPILKRSITGIVSCCFAACHNSDALIAASHKIIIQACSMSSANNIIFDGTRKYF